MISVSVNGVPKELVRGTTVAELLEGLGLRTDGVAVAVNRRVIPQSEHASLVLPSGAKIEVIRAVGGG
jgi:thiamine biosynthesis protein ThiS